MNSSQSTATQSQILVIAGMHRSGTSLLAGILQTAGLNIGQSLLEANEWNPKGYFENVDFVDFHRAVLQAQQISKDGWTLQEEIVLGEQCQDQAQEIIARNSNNSLWGWKDPRTTLFLDFWAKVLPEANFLLLYRAPWEVIDSLYRRGDEPFQAAPELAVKIWQHYNQKIIQFCNRFPKRFLLTNINIVIRDPQRYINQVNHLFGTDLVAPAENFYEASLFKTDNTIGHRPSLIANYFPDVIELYQELETRSWQPGTGLDLSWRDEMRNAPYRVWAFQDWISLCQLEASHQGLQQKYQTLETNSSGLESQLKQSESQLQKSQAKLYETQTVLEQSQKQLQETESTLEQYQSRLQETQIQVTQSQSYEQQQQMQLHAVQEELEQSLSQLHQAESLLEKYNVQLKQMQSELEKSKFEQSLLEGSEDIYQSLVSKAWFSYKNQDLNQMAQYLKQSMSYYPGFQSEILLKWIESFAQLSAQSQESFNAQVLTQTSEWKQLMHRVMSHSSNSQKGYIPERLEQNHNLTKVREQLSQSKTKLAQVEADLQST
ncbi:MAG: sulfotransferase [Microcoleaceae cyanobacterium]